MDRADIDRLRALAAMMKPLAELPAMLDRALSADQAVREAEAKAAKITAENLDTMQASARIRDEIAAARVAAAEAATASQDRCAQIVADAEKRAKSLVDNAQATAKEVLLRAHDEADAARREAATIGASIADKREEYAKLEAKLAKIREQLKKMTEI